MPERYVLPSGRVVRLELPDLWALVSSAGRIPNPVVMAVLDLLIKDGSYTPEGPGADLYLRKREEILGIYATAALCLVEPRLAIGRPPQEGEISPRELAFGDAEVIYYRWFRHGDPSLFGVAPDPQDAAGVAGAAPDLRDVPPDSE